MLLYFVLGLGGGIIVTGANALASDVDETRRASTLNFLNLFFGLGGLLTPFLAANLLHGDSAEALLSGCRARRRRPCRQFGSENSAAHWRTEL